MVPNEALSHLAHILLLDLAGAMRSLTIIGLHAFFGLQHIEIQGITCHLWVSHDQNLQIFWEPKTKEKNVKKMFAPNATKSQIAINQTC